MHKKRCAAEAHAPRPHRYILYRILIICVYVTQIIGDSTLSVLKIIYVCVGFMTIIIIFCKYTEFLLILQENSEKSSTLFHFPSQCLRRISPILFRMGLLRGGSRQRGVRCPGRRSRGLSRRVHRCRPEHLPCRPSRAARLHAVRRRQCRRG